MGSSGRPKLAGALKGVSTPTSGLDGDARSLRSPGHEPPGVVTSSVIEWIVCRCPEGVDSLEQRLETIRQQHDARIAGPEDDAFANRAGFAFEDRPRTDRELIEPRIAAYPRGSLIQLLSPCSSHRCLAWSRIRTRRRSSRAFGSSVSRTERKSLLGCGRGGGLNQGALGPEVTRVHSWPGLATEKAQARTSRQCFVVQSFGTTTSNIIASPRIR